MSWQDLVLTICSVVFVLSLAPALIQRRVPPLSTCATTAAPLTVIAGVDVTLNLFFTAGTTALTAAMWWACAYLARRPADAR